MLTTPDLFDVPPKSKPKDLDGRKLSRRLHKLNATRRAQLAADLVTGELCFLNLTPRQAAELLDVSRPYIDTLTRATVKDRARLEYGLVTLSELHKRRRQPTDSDIERMVTKIGPDRVWRVLDKITAPKPHHLVAAE